jgi:hypothetical protein
MERHPNNDHHIADGTNALDLAGLDRMGPGHWWAKAVAHLAIFDAAALAESRRSGFPSHAGGMASSFAGDLDEMR